MLFILTLYQNFLTHEHFIFTEYKFILFLTGVSYGEGVYFATEASYSLSFSKPPNSKGECCMFLAKVLSGKYATGKERMKTPPPIDPNKGELLYDSVVNSTDDPTVFVVFQDDQCYPKYLITFKCLSSYY